MTGRTMPVREKSSSSDSEQIYPVGEDTLLLLDAAEEEIRPSDHVLEVGTGSGYISRRIVGCISSLVATEINPYAVKRVRAQGIEVVRTNLMAGICGRFDLILFNPPYLPTHPEERIDDWLEYALDGGLSGREVIRRFSMQAGDVLEPKGRILLLISNLTGQKEVEDLFEHQGFVGRIVQETSVEGELLFVYKFHKR